MAGFELTSLENRKGGGFAGEPTEPFPSAFITVPLVWHPIRFWICTFREILQAPPGPRIQTLPGSATRVELLLVFECSEINSGGSGVSSPQKAPSLVNNWSVALAEARADTDLSGFIYTKYSTK